MSWNISKSGPASKVAAELRAENPAQYLGDPVERTQCDIAKSLVLAVVDNLTPPDRLVSVSANGSHNSSCSVSISPS